ncbi:MAG: alpha/beta hydrolase [Pseudomonadota bacterium]
MTMPPPGVRALLRRTLAGALAALGLAAATAASAATAGAAADAQALTPCRVAGVATELRCGAVARPLDPARPGGPKIEVHYAVSPAATRRKWRDPVVVLAGGPGLSAIAGAPQMLAVLGRLNQRRDIVFVDQRGTGRSAPLDCGDGGHRSLAALADLQLQVAEAAACHERLAKLPYGELAFFTTPYATQDLDAVRLQLGAARINLVGSSYGTRAALDYLRQFPGAVRRTVLDGVIAPDTLQPLSFSSDGQRALDLLLAACEQDAACRRDHPELRRNWAQLLAGLPREVVARHPLTGQAERFTATRAMVLVAVRTALYSPSLAAALPFAIDEAAQGRFEPLVGLKDLVSPREGTAPAMGMHYSVVCGEDFPRFAAATDKPGADFGTDFAQFYSQVCAGWPRRAIPAAFYTVPRASSPVLALGGGLDPAAAPRHAEAVVKALGPNARHVVVTNAGHGVMGIGCLRDVVFRFIDADDDASALAADAACASAVPRPPAFRPYVLELPK